MAEALLVMIILFLAMAIKPLLFVCMMLINSQQLFLLNENCTFLGKFTITLL